MTFPTGENRFLPLYKIQIQSFVKGELSVHYFNFPPDLREYESETFWDCDDNGKKNNHARQTFCIYIVSMCMDMRYTTYCYTTSTNFQKTTIAAKRLIYGQRIRM